MSENYYKVKEDTLTGIADNVRRLTGTSDLIDFSEINTVMEGIEIGINTSDATATAADILSGKTAYVKGNKITGNIAFQAAKIITPNTINQTAISSGYYASGTVTVKGDSNLVAGNIKSGVSIFGVNGTYEGDGGTEVEDSFYKIIDRTISGSYENTIITSIGNYAFTAAQKLTSVNFPNCTNIGSYAFQFCYSLASLSFPNCTNIGNDAFYGCNNLIEAIFSKCSKVGMNTFSNCARLKYISFPVLTAAGQSAFAECRSLTSVNFPVLSKVNAQMFESCTSLVSTSFPACTSINYSAFVSCTALTNISFPECAIVSSYAFKGCTKLSIIELPKCTSIYGSVFYSCASLKSLRLPVCKSIMSYAFYSCTNLSQITLENSTVCRLSNSNAFSKTGIWNTKGSIFVPASLVDSYKTATNWAYFSNRIFSIAE